MDKQYKEWKDYDILFLEDVMRFLNFYQLGMKESSIYFTARGLRYKEEDVQWKF